MRQTWPAPTRRPPAFAASSIGGQSVAPDFMAGSPRRERRPPPPPAAHRLPIDVRTTLEALAAFYALVMISEAPVFFLIKIGVNEALGPLINVFPFSAHLVALIGLLSLGLRRAWAAVTALGLAYLVCLILAATRARWSLEQVATLRFTLQMIGTTFVGVWLGARFGWGAMARWIGSCGLVLGFLSMLLSIGPGKLGVMTGELAGAWSGLWEEKNRFGMVMAVSGTALCAAYMEDRRKAWLVGVLYCAFLIVMAKSATSLVALVGACGILFAAELYRRGPAVGLALASTGIALIGAIVALAVFAPDTFTAIIGREATFTSRTDIWAGVMPSIIERPVWGWGYGAFWDWETAHAQAVWDRIGFKAQTAHNGWLETLIGLGGVGLALATLWVLRAFPHVVRSLIVGGASAFGLAVMLSMIVFSVTESVLFQPNTYIWAVTVAVAVRAALEAQKRSDLARRTPREAF